MSLESTWRLAPSRGRDACCIAASNDQSMARRGTIYLIIACSLGCGFPSPTKKKPEDHVNTKKASLKGIVVEVEIDKTSHAEGPLNMTVTLTNNGQAAAWYGDFGDIVDCRADVRDAGGNAAAPTVRGSNIFGLGDDGDRGGQYANMRLEPGTSKSWPPYDLSRCFKFKSGDHTLSLTVEFNSKGLGPDMPFSITVEKVPFTIK